VTRRTGLQDLRLLAERVERRAAQYRALDARLSPHLPSADEEPEQPRAFLLALMAPGAESVRILGAARGALGRAFTQLLHATARSDDVRVRE